MRQRKAVGTLVALLASILVILATVTSANAQDWGKTGEVTANVVATYLELGGVDRDIGGTPQGTMIKMPFTITNHSDAVQQVQFDHICSEPEITIAFPQAQSVNAGETKELTLHFMVRHKAELTAFDVAIRARTDETMVVGHITGSVWVAKIHIEPLLLELGDVYQGSTHDFEFTVKNSATVAHLVTFINHYPAGTSLYVPEGYEFYMNPSESRVLAAQLSIAGDAELGPILIEILPYQTWDWTAPP